MARLLLSDENLRCSICLETFKEPKVLPPCCHTFCKGYMSKLPMMKKPESELSVRGEQPSRDREPSPGVSTDHEVSDESDEGEEMLLETLSSDVTASVASEDAAQKILGPPDDHTDQEDDSSIESVNSDLVDYLTCPHCRAEHMIIGPNGVDGFLTDYIAESHLKDRDANSSVSATNSLKCDGCESLEPVVAFCGTCSEYLCDFCSAAHKRLKTFLGHNVKHVVDLDINEANKEAIVSRKPSVLFLCRKHPKALLPRV